MGTASTRRQTHVPEANVSTVSVESVGKSALCVPTDPVSTTVVLTANIARSSTATLAMCCQTSRGPPS
jgi:hypothetical protein